MSTREDLIATGVRLLETEGLTNLTLRRIATVAGVSHGAPRHYFPTYGALLAAVARSGVEALDSVLSRCFASQNHREAIFSAAMEYVRFALERPDMFELIFRHDLLEGQGGELRTMTAGWYANLDDAVTNVLGHPDPVKATALWSGVHGVAVLLSRRAVEPVDAVGDATPVLLALIEGVLDISPDHL